MQFICVYSSRPDICADVIKQISAATHVIDKGFNQARLLIYSDQQISKYNVVNSINDQGDIDVTGRDAFISNQHQTVAAKLLLDDNAVTFVTDCFGIFHFYYYRDNDKLIVSNNIFLIAALTDPDYSREGIWDALLFKQPFMHRTIFENVFCTMPNEIIRLELESGKLELMGGKLEEELFDSEPQDYAEVALEYYVSARQMVEKQNLTPGISLSSGSDSFTVLAGLRAAGLHPSAYSWGEDNYSEVPLVQKLADKYNLQWNLKNFDQYKENELQLFQNAQLTSNGLAPLAHSNWYYHYSCIPKSTALFEGFGGSEFCKAELSYFMWSVPYKNLITGKLNPQEYLHSYFQDIREEERTLIIQYLLDNYMDYFKNINTEEGFISHRRYVLYNVLNKVFTGIFNSGCSLGVKLYEPFIYKKFLSALFSRHLGLGGWTSLSAGYPGPYKAYYSQAMIIKRLAPEMMKHRQNRGISMNEVLYPGELLMTLVYARKGLGKITKTLNPGKRRNLFQDQTDYSRFETMPSSTDLNPILGTLLKPTYQRQNSCLENLNRKLNAIRNYKEFKARELLRDHNESQA